MYARPVYRKNRAWRKPPPRRFVYTAVAGGTAWTATPSDSVTMSDALAFDRGLAVSDSVTMSDSLAFQRTVTISDSVTMSDSVTFDRQLVITDSVTMSDGVAANRGIAQSIADSVTMSDGTTQDSGKGVSVSDSVTMSDSVAFQRSVTISDSVTMSDSTAFQRSVTVTDTATMSDALAFQRSWTITDTVTMGDLADPVKTSGGTGAAPPRTRATHSAGPRGVVNVDSFDGSATVAGPSGMVGASGETGLTIVRHKYVRPSRVCVLGVSDQALGGVVIATVEGQIGRQFHGLRQNADISTNWVNTGGHITQYGNGKTTSYRACQNDPATETYAAAISGTYDTSFTTTVTNIVNSGKWTPSNPFILCYGHETTVAQWAPLGTAQGFIDAFRHYRNLLDSLGASVRTKAGAYQGGCIVMAYVGWDRMYVGAGGVGPPTAGQGVDDYDPDKGSSPAPTGTSYYEYIGSDVYNSLASPGVLTYGTDALTLLTPLVNAAIVRGKDFIIGEMGCPDGATSQDHVNKAAWLDSLRVGLIARGQHRPGVCRALLTTVKSSSELYNVDSSAESLAAFQRLGASTYFA